MQLKLLTNKLRYFKPRNTKRFLSFLNMMQYYVLYLYNCACQPNWVPNSQTGPHFCNYIFGFVHSVNYSWRAVICATCQQAAVKRSFRPTSTGHKLKKNTMLVFYYTYFFRKSICVYGLRLFVYLCVHINVAIYHENGLLHQFITTHFDCTNSILSCTPIITIEYSNYETFQRFHKNHISKSL